jgi:hypothetical protein
MILFALIGIFGASYPIVISHGRSFLPAHLTGRGVTLLNLFGMGGAGVMQFASGPVYAESGRRQQPGGGLRPALRALRARHPDRHGGLHSSPATGPTDPGFSATGKAPATACPFPLTRPSCKRRAS